MWSRSALAPLCGADTVATTVAAMDAPTYLSTGTFRVAAVLKIHKQQQQQPEKKKTK